MTEKNSTETYESTVTRLETMADFFTARLEGYEAHMLADGGEAVYQRFASLIPTSTQSILDLGCGTGLELDAIFKRLPAVAVLGIDLTRAMLEKLKQKHPAQNLRLVCADYFKFDFGENCFDTAVSFQTLHHFTHERKLGLYRKINKALKPGGVYLECDYMLTNPAEEERLAVENTRLRQASGIAADAFYHFDIPFTFDHQVTLLKEAGFYHVEMVYRLKNTTIISARCPALSL